jgi:hypothetical protein
MVKQGNKIISSGPKENEDMTIIKFFFAKGVFSSQNILVLGTVAFCFI